MSKVRRVKVNGGAWNDDSVTKAWQDCAPFTTSTKSLRGDFDTPGSVFSGRLNNDERNSLREWEAKARATDARFYVVNSYSTPIAWAIVYNDGTTERYKVGQRFSVTTSKHQGRLY